MHGMTVHKSDQDARSAESSPPRPNPVPSRREARGMALSAPSCGCPAG